MKVHEEFGEAMEEAQFRALAWWEDVGQAGLTMPKFNASLYAYAMKNRFRDSYSDKPIDLAPEEEPAERELTNLELEAAGPVTPALSIPQLRNFRVHLPRK